MVWIADVFTQYLSLSAFGLNRNFWSKRCHQSYVADSPFSLPLPERFWSLALFQVSLSSLTKLEFFCWSSMLLCAVLLPTFLNSFIYLGRFSYHTPSALPLIQTQIPFFSNLCSLLTTHWLTTFVLFEKTLCVSSRVWILLRQKAGFSSGSWALLPHLCCFLAFEETQWLWPSCSIPAAWVFYVSCGGACKGETVRMEEGGNERRAGN